MADIEFPRDLELIKKKAISGVVTFTLRTFFIQVFTFVATFILTIIISPSIFGVFFVVSAFINLFVYFSDIGLAAALIQKKEELTKEDLSTTFTIQQVIVISLVVIGLVFSSKIALFYHLDAKGLMLLRALILSLFLSSLKTIPSILLERKLNFTRLVIPQVAENIVFYTTAVILALSGYGISSFTWAVATRAVTGLVLIYLLSPWVPTFSFRGSVAKSLTSFGVPFQANSILALLKDDLLTVFLGKILTFSQVGYIGWAQKWAYTPLRFFMDNVNKVTFPAYSRLQDHYKELAKAIEKSIFFVTYFVFPSVFGMVALAPYVIELVPNYYKWQPALPLLYLFGINAIFSAVSTTFTNALFAIGRPKIVLKLMVFWTAAIWILTYLLVLRFGFVGVGLASAVVSITSAITIYLVKKEIPVSVGKNILGPLFMAILMFLCVRSVINYLPANIFGLIFAVAIGAIIYFVISLTIFKKHLMDDAKLIISSILSSQK